MVMEFLADYIGVLGFLAVAALAGVWFFVPFAIFGAKNRLDVLIDELEETNKHLADIKAILTSEAAEPAGRSGEGDIDFPSIRASR
jgi:hypothetical protein